MKYFLFLALLACTVAHADAPTLGDNMKQIGSLTAAITAAISNPALNAQSAADAEQLAALFTTVQGQVPDSISALPQAQQAAALQEFQGLIQQEINDSNSLAQDFQNGDNTDAATVLQQMQAIKVQGHQKFAQSP